VREQQHRTHGAIADPLWFALDREHLPIQGCLARFHQPGIQVHDPLVLQIRQLGGWAKA
jgi:hypothetical protein